MTSATSRGGIGGLNVEFNELKGESLDLHKPLEQEVDLISGRTVIYSSVSPIEETGDVEFHIPPDPECHFLLNQSRLEGYFVVKDLKGKFLDEKDEVTLANHYGACLFSQIEVYLNGTQVCDLSASVSYPFKHNIDVTLSYPFSVSNYLFKTEGYYTAERKNEFKLVFKDVAEEVEMDEDGNEPTDTATGTVSERTLDTALTDPRLVENHNRIMNGKKVYFSTVIPADIFYSDKYLPPNVEINIKLRRFNPMFGLISKSTSYDRYNICLQDVKLRMRKALTTVRVRNRINVSLNEKNSPCVIPYKDTQLKFYNIPFGSLSFSANFINAGRKMPVQIVFALVRSRLLGRNVCTDSPFYYSDANLSSVMLKKDGKPLLPRIMRCNFDNGDYVHMYDHFQSNVNTRNRVTLDNYKKGYTFMVFDLTPDKCHSFHNHNSESGSLALDLTFSKLAQSDYTLLSYAVYNALLLIGKDRQVQKRYY